MRLNRLENVYRRINAGMSWGRIETKNNLDLKIEIEHYMKRNMDTKIEVKDVTKIWRAENAREKVSSEEQEYKINWSK